MALEIKPLVEALVTEDEFLSGAFNFYTVLNVLSNDGTLYRYSAFSANRRLLRKVCDTGMKRIPATTQLREIRQFLPNGQKIPVEMLNQIIAFFKAVMKGIDLGTGSGVANTNVAMANRATTSYTANGNYEAMIHVLWNKETQEYRLAVPTQRVSKGAVSYDRDHIMEGDEIILDIHSHNTMGAFFSGTDNNDDKSGFYLSGVAGQLDKAKPAFVWRFNNGAEKIEVTADDIFLNPMEAPIEVPQEWLSKVSVSYASVGLPIYSGYAGGNRVNVGGVGGTVRVEDGFDEVDVDVDTWLQRNNFQGKNFGNRGLARVEAQTSLQNAKKSVSQVGGMEKKSNASSGNFGDVPSVLIAGGEEFDFREAEKMYDLLMGKDRDVDEGCDMQDLVEEIINIGMGLNDDSRSEVIKEFVADLRDFSAVNEDGIYVVGDTKSAIRAIKDITDCYLIPDPTIAGDLTHYINAALSQ